MSTSDGSSTDLVRWELSPAPRAFVLEGEILGETPEGQIRLLHEILQNLPETSLVLNSGLPYQLADQAAALLGRPLPYTAEDLQRLLEVLVDGGVRGSISVRLLTHVIRHVERFAMENGLPTALRPALERERGKLRPFPGANAYGRLLVRIERLLERQDAGMPDPSEAWASAMLSSVAAMDDDACASWRALLAHAARMEQTRPSAKWLRAAREYLEQVGLATFRTQVLSWLSAAAEPCERTLSERNSAVIKGLAWTCCVDDDTEIARALSRLAEALLRWLPSRLDWRGLKAGNACLNALAMMPGPEPLRQLSRLSYRLKGKQLQTSVGRAIEAALDRRGLPREDLEELMIPTHGVDTDGCLRAEVGDVRAELGIAGASGLEWRWIVGGAEQQAAPASIRKTHAGELRALRATAEEIRRTLSAQRARLESLYVADRSWGLSEWRSRYLDHPLLRQMTRSLIWEVQTPVGDAWLGIPAGEGFEDVEGRPFGDPAGDSTVRLWHPLGWHPTVVESWGRRLSELGIVQPFKQVERELYALTPEEWAAGASARFAGRILRQQQLSALCRERGWQYAVQGPWDGGAPHALRPLAPWGVRAEFWVQMAQGGQAEVTRTGFYPHVSSDVLRFRGLDGGACLLTEVPERVISEVLRDVDLFVSVADAAR